MTDLHPSDLTPEGSPRSRWRRWQGLIGLVALAGVAIAAATTIDDAREQTLPSPAALAAALALHVTALVFGARAWCSLFPIGVDCRSLARGLYTSQLTKYLPAGGLVQAASQVALSREAGGVAAAALRLPVFSLCSIVAGSTLASGLAFSSAIPMWARILAGCSISSVALLDRRVSSAALRLARRFVHRLPPADSVPPQGAILCCYALMLGNLAAYGAAFAVLINDVADVNPLVAAAALCGAWVVGYLVVPLPSGVGVREAVLVATLPGVAAASLLSASVAHRLVGIVAEAGLAGGVRLRPQIERRRAKARQGTPGPAATDA